MGQKYNRIMPESEGNVLCVEIADRVTLKDYETIIRPAICNIADNYDEYNSLVFYSEPFPGWDLDAAARDLETMTEYAGNLRKVALVDPPEKVLVRWQALKPLLGGELRFYTSQEFDKALSWVKT